MRLLEAEALQQALDLELLVPEHERDDDAGLAGPGGAARAVQVGLVVLGRVVVDDDVDVVDVDAAGGDVGGDEHRELARREVGERPLAGALAQVAVDGAGLHALALELLDEAVGAALGAHEHHRAVDAAGDRGDDLHLVHLVDEEEAVVHLVDGDRRSTRPRAMTGSCW